MVERIFISSHHRVISFMYFTNFMCMLCMCYILCINAQYFYISTILSVVKNMVSNGFFVCPWSSDRRNFRCRLGEDVLVHTSHNSVHRQKTVPRATQRTREDHATSTGAAGVFSLVALIQLPDCENVPHVKDFHSIWATGDHLATTYFLKQLDSSLGLAGLAADFHLTK